MSKVVIWAILVLSLVAAPVRAAEERKPLNILMIAVDDLRPELACYGKTQIVSPNIDALAARGALFEKAYCQQAVCAPSRVSLLTGCRPDTTKVTDLKTPLPTVRADLVTLPQQLRGAGYTTVSLGKIYHHGAGDDPKGWTMPPWQPSRRSWPSYMTEENIKLEQSLKAEPGKAKLHAPPFESADAPDEEFVDGAVAVKAVSELARLKEEGKPFFLAVGFTKPHLPFVAPKACWDLYDPAKIELADNPYYPKDTPDIAGSDWGELRHYQGMPQKGPVSEEQARKLVHGYYACVSHTDRLVGKVVAELDRLGLKESTVIVLWGDHGWHLGDHGMWCKHTNFEIATRAPMIFAGPGVPAGTRVPSVAEFVDIYPTLCELAGVDKPGHLEGTSLTPVMRDPSKPVKDAAYSLYPHQGRTGYTVTDGRWRFTKWEAGKRGGKEEFELYDHQSDPKENQNLAYQDESKADRERMEKLLSQGWKVARP